MMLKILTISAKKFSIIVIAAIFTLLAIYGITKTQANVADQVTDSQINTRNQQDYSWGVLAINANKSVYLPNETAHLEFAVLDEKGMMVCDANLTLTITNPDGTISKLSTEAGEIQVNSEVCQSYDLTSIPDYQATYLLKNDGKYLLHLEAITKNGSYSIDDQVLVDANSDFYIERESTSRVYPINKYPVRILVTPSSDFQGTITETIPEGFILSEVNPPEMSQDANTLNWQVDWKAGQTYDLSYTFDAPDKSPEFYLLGPLKMSVNASIVYQEPRQWQLATDAVSFLGSTQNNTNNGGDVTLDLSGLGLQENDLVIVAYSIADADNVDMAMTNVGGTWTEVADLFANDTGADANLGVYYRVMTATPDSSVTLDGVGGADTDNSAVAMAFRGVDPTNPMDVTPTTIASQNTMHPNPPLNNHNNPAGVWTVIAGSNAIGTQGLQTFTFPSGYTTNAVQQSADDTIDGIVGMGYRTSPADPEDPGVMTSSGLDNLSFASAAVTMTLRPAITGITISGTANGNDGATVKYAVNGTPGAQTDALSGGTWSITGVTTPSANDIITVWVDNVADNLETSAVTKYSTGDVTGMVLDTNVTTIGSDQNTGLTLTNLDLYDCTGDEDIMYQAGSSTLKVEGDSCAGATTNSYSTPEIEILSGDTLTVGGTETLNTYDLTITGTLTSGGASTYNIEHNWANTGTFTNSTSTVNLTGAGGTTQTISGTNTFYTLSATGSTARTIKFPSSVTTTVSNALTLTGAAAQLLTLSPSTAATSWSIDPPPSNISVSYADINYSNAVECISATNSQGTNNTLWTYDGTSCPLEAYSMKTGYYVGSGSDNQAVTGVGFQPELVFVKDESTNGTDGINWKSSVMSGEVSALLADADADNSTDVIQSLDSDGFTLGTDADVNTANLRFNYTAFSGSNCSASGTFCVGSYTGDGNTTQSITSIGFEPALVMIKSSGGNYGVWRTSSMPTDVSQFFYGSSEDTTGTMIKSLDSNGFTVGNHNVVNINSNNYWFVAFRSADDVFAEGSFTGDGTDNRSITAPAFEPDSVWIKNSDSLTANPVYYNARNVSFGDNSTAVSDANNITGAIKSLDATGFTVGANTVANESAKTIYWFAFTGESPMTASGTYQMKTGSYSGNGSSQAISGLGFNPDLVIIDSGSTTYSVFRTASMKGDATLSKTVGAGVFTGGITSLDSDGFSVGSHVDVNTNATTYYYQAFGNAFDPETGGGGAADFAIGTYTGSGGDNRDITELPFQPDLVVVRREGSYDTTFKTSAMAGDSALEYGSSGVGTDEIQALNADGFEVGTISKINGLGGTVFYYAFKAGNNLKVGSYTGTGSAQDITAPGITPSLVWVKSAGASTAVWRPSGVVGDSTFYFENTAALSDRITALLSNGFSLGGNQSVTNTNGETYQYVVWQTPNIENSAYSFQRKTWYDGTRYWRSYHNETDSRIEFKYSTDGTSWTENTSARIDVDTNDFSIYADSTNAFIAYKTGIVTNEDNILLDNLVGFWKLDEGTSATCAGSLDSCDSSGGGYHGDWVNNATNATGKFGNGIAVDGTGDYVSIAEADTDGPLDHSNGDAITVSAWIKPTSLPGAGTWDTYVGKNSATDGWYLQLDENGNIEWYLFNNPDWSGFTTTTTPISAGAWHHVAVTQTFGNDASIKIYVNGVEQAYGIGGITDIYPDPHNSSLSIGANFDGSEEATGTIDDVRVYNTVLTPEQISKLGLPGYDIEVREATTYPTTGFSWSNETILYNGSSATDYYQYPTIAYDSNSKIWVIANKYATGTIDEQISAADDDGVDVLGDNTFHTNNNPDVGPWTGCALSEANCIPIGGKDISSNTITTGLRFQTVNIPYGAVISTATIDLKNMYAGDYGASVYNVVKGAKVSNLSIFSDSNLPRNVTSTTTTAVWSSQNESIANGTWYSATTSNQPPSITSIVQEIVDQSGWSTNNNMGILVTDSSSDADWWYEAYSYESGAANAAKLHIEYTASQIVSSQASSANDIASWGTTSILDSSTNTNKYGVIIPRTSGAVYATWIDGTAIEGKNYNGTSWDGSPTAIATGLSGLTNSHSAVADSAGNVHLAYINSSGQTIYQEFTSSWQTAVTLDSNAGNEYPTISYNSNNNNLFAFWVRGEDILYKKAISNYTSGNWDSVATSWQTTGANTYLTSNYSGSGKIFAEWIDGTAINWGQLNINVLPNTPTLDAPTDTATGQSLTLALKTTATDTDSDYLRYKIELCEDSGMSINCQTFDQTVSQTGWSGQDAQTSTAYASGTQATYTLQTPLVLNDTYYWRSYTIDPGGTDTWSSTQGTPYSFSTMEATTATSFQRKTWHDGTRYWRSFQDSIDNRIEFEYSTDGTSWTEDTSARIDVDTSDFSVWADNTEAYIAYKTGAVANTDNLSTSGLVGYWKMNESSWNGTTDEVIDSSATGNDGLRIGDATTTTGKFGNGGTFDGTSDYVSVTDAANLRPNNGSWTMSAWFNPANVNQTTSILNKTNLATGETYGITITGDVTGSVIGKKISGGIQESTGGTRRSAITVNDIVDGNWHHATLVLDSNADSINIYIDGVLQSITTDNSGPWPTVNNTDNLAIGSFIAGYHYDGVMDDVRIYNRALNANEVASLANPGYDIEVRKASSYPGTGFAWETENVALNGSSSSILYQYPTITQDSADKIWVGGTKNTSGTYTWDAARSTSANTATIWDASASLDSSSNANKYGVIVPRTSSAAYGTWIDGTTIEGKNYNGSAWDGSPTTIATGTTGLTTTLSTVGDSSGDVHLLYIDDNGKSVYRKFISSWSNPIVLDSNSGNEYPTISLNSSNDDVFSFWERGDDIYYKKGENITSSGSALQFDGSADYALVPYNANYDVTDNLTVELWFKPGVTIDSGISADMGLMSKANTNADANNDWVFFWNSGEAGQLRFGSYGENVRTTTSTWTAGTWYHVAATVTNTNTAYIYVNGVLDNYGGDTSIAANPISADQDTVLNIGLSKVSTGDKYFNGQIDDVRIYNAVRSQTEIQSDINSELAGTETNLIGYWNMNEGTGQTIADLDSNANNGTLGATSGSSTDDPSWVTTIPFNTSWDTSATSWQTTGTNAYLSSNYSATSKVFVEWLNGNTINWDKILLNTKPATPSLDAPSDAAISQILSTVLKTTTTDPESDYIRYKIELCEDSGMSVNCQTFDQTSSQTGWSGQDAQTSTAYASGTQATYTLQTPLALNDTYYWRSYAIDPAGSNTWSSTQGTHYSFTTIAAPVVSSISVNTGTTITLTEGTTTEISWIGTVTDADGNANISSALGTLYRSGVVGTEACTPDNNNCYADASCTLSACAGNSCTATCTVNLEFFAEPTDSTSLFSTEYWQGWIQATDAQSQTGASFSAAGSPDVESLAAMDVTSAITYDPLLPGDDSGATNKTTTITNTGNTVLDVEVSGDNFCTDYPTCSGYQIPVGYQEFDLSGFTYGVGTALSGTPVTAQTDLMKSTIKPANSSTYIYWGLGIPSPKEDGSYSGANTITAVDGD